jgi:hypothetical protein
MIENTQQAEEFNNDDDIHIEIVADPPEGQTVKSSEDELENYTKSVSKRINKLNAKNRQAEDRAAQLRANCYG